MSWIASIIGHIAARERLTPVIESLALDDARASALVERSLGLAAQIK